MAILSNYSRRRDRREEARRRSTKSSTTIRLPGTKGGETRRRPWTIWLIPAIAGRRRRGAFALTGRLPVASPGFATTLGHGPRPSGARRGSSHEQDHRVREG